MKATIIAEIGSNWEGDLRKGRKLIRESKKAGADLVKFQMWRATDLYSKKHPNCFWSRAIQFSTALQQFFKGFDQFEFAHKKTQTD